MTLLSWLRSKLDAKPRGADDVSSPPSASRPPVNIDWNKWEAPGPGDVRSPCPMMNALANHHILPHSGKNITKALAVKALSESVNLSPEIASLFAAGGMRANPDHTAHFFDLDHLNKHGVIEHDVSLSRDDATTSAAHDNHSFNRAIFDAVIATYGDATTTDFHSASKARYARVQACKTAHENAGDNADFVYGIKELILSYGETALLLALLGDPKDGRIPVEYLRVLFQEERVPFKEGWRKQDTPIRQRDMNHLLLNLVAANEHKVEEAAQVGLGTIHAVNNAVESMMGDYCSVM